MIHSTSDSHKLLPIVIAVSLFILLDACVFAINYWITWQIEKDAAAINMAGRQRMLSQRMTKSALLLRTPDLEATERQSISDEFFDSASLFDETLTALRRGGETTSGDVRVIMPHVVDGEARAVLDDAYRVWAPIHSRIVRAGSAGQLMNASEAGPVSQDLLASNAILLGLMNRLTLGMEQASRGRTNELRYFLTIAFVLALVNFMVVVRILMLRYREAASQGRQLVEIINQIGAGVCALDQNDRIVSSNRQSLLLLGCTEDELNGKGLDEVFVADGQVWRSQIKPDRLVYVELVRGVITDDGGRQSIVTLLDVTDRHRYALELLHQAQHDTLTGLPNRALLSDRLAVSIAQAMRQQSKIGLALLDLDGFKPINDQYGHAVGDQVLVEIAKRLARCARAGDTVARMGGDEFLYVLNDVGTREDLQQLVERIRQVISEPIMLDGQPLHVGASFGLSVFPDDAQDVGELIAMADSDMYAEKSRRKQDGKVKASRN